MCVCVCVCVFVCVQLVHLYMLLHPLFSFIQFPTKYLEQSRSFLWENCLYSIVNSSQDPTHDRCVSITLCACHMTVSCSLSSLLKAVEMFEVRLGPPPNTRFILAVDNRLRKQTQDQHARLQKVLTQTPFIQLLQVLYMYIAAQTVN